TGSEADRETCPDCNSCEDCGTFLGDSKMVYVEQIRDEIKDFISDLLSKEREIYYQKGMEGKAPMGVSQWKNHGDKYHYSEFWKNKLFGKLIIEIGEMNHTNEDVWTWNEAKNHLIEFIKKID
ncbi:MAG: hypothetical protein WD512_20855, partial [Candidatus Paceibacterota bacterium]